MVHNGQCEVQQFESKYLFYVIFFSYTDCDNWTSDRVRTLNEFYCLFNCHLAEKIERFAFSILPFVCLKGNVQRDGSGRKLAHSIGLS
jgi:hypothetical protein